MLYDLSDIVNLIEARTLESNGWAKIEELLRRGGHEFDKAG